MLIPDAYAALKRRSSTLPPAFYYCPRSYYCLRFYCCPRFCCCPRRRVFPQPRKGANLQGSHLRHELLRLNQDFVHHAEILMEEDMAVKHESAGDGGVAEIHAHLDAVIWALS